MTWRQFYGRIERFGVQRIRFENGASGLLRVMPDGRRLFKSDHVYLDVPIKDWVLEEACKILEIDIKEITG